MKFVFESGDLLLPIVLLIVGIATFMIGMNMMSSSLKKVSGAGVKKLFKKTEGNALANVGIGAATTALVQSSAATSVMTIGFLSAGAMTVYQGAATILGAYLGTTITGVLASFSSFPISTYLLLLAAVGVIMTFFKNETVKNIGGIFAGLGLLFFGLAAMSGVFKSSEEIKGAVTTLCQSLDNNPVGPILLWLVGVVLTVLFQSSSATTGIVIVLVGQNPQMFASGMYLILGATVGTVITTILASIGGNIAVKRVTVIAILNRVICSIIGIAIIWPLSSYISTFFQTSFGTIEFGLAMFLVIYNIIFLAIWIPILKPVVNLITKLVKDKDAEKKKKVLLFIDDHLLKTPDIALMQLGREVAHMYELAFANYKLGVNAMSTQDLKEEKLITETEENLDYINNAITNFLIQLSNHVSLKQEKLIGSYFHIINDIERIGDHAYNFLESAKKMKEGDLKFSDTAKAEFEQMNAPIVKMFELGLIAINNQHSDDLRAFHDLEDETDKLKVKLSAKHFDRITNQECHIELSPFYSTYVSELERVADHLVNIGYAFENPTGDEQ